MPTSFALAIKAPSPDLVALVRATQSGDAAALGALYDAYADVLYQTAYRLLRSSDDAEDVVHDCFVGLPEALRHYEERGQLEAWLRRIVVRLVLMRRRGNARRRETSLEETPVILSSTRTDAAAEMTDVNRAVNALPASLRDVFLLKQVEGYAHEEIAQLLGITAGASRARLTRALDSLRRVLTPRH